MSADELSEPADDPPDTESETDINDSYGTELTPIYGRNMTETAEYNGNTSYNQQLSDTYLDSEVAENARRGPVPLPRKSLTAPIHSIRYREDDLRYAPAMPPPVPAITSSSSSSNTPSRPVPPPLLSNSSNSSKPQSSAVATPAVSPVSSVTPSVVRYPPPPPPPGALASRPGPPPPPPPVPSAGGSSSPLKIPAPPAPVPTPSTSSCPAGTASVAGTVPPAAVRAMAGRPLPPLPVSPTAVSASSEHKQYESQQDAAFSSESETEVGAQQAAQQRRGGPSPIKRGAVTPMGHATTTPTSPKPFSSTCGDTTASPVPSGTAEDSHGTTGPLSAAQEARGLIPIHALLPHELIAVSQHETYNKYFKMLKVGIPKPSVQKKMREEGVNVLFLELRPEDLVPIQETTMADTIAAYEHPVYKRYFKMIKVGLTVEAVREKMQQDGYDAFVLDGAPEQLVPLGEARKFDPDSSNNRAPAHTGGSSQNRKSKRVFIQGLDASRIAQDSLWASDAEEDIDLDKSELQRLFVAGDTAGTGKYVSGATDGSANRMSMRVKAVSLIDAKRAQNAAISLARIKFSFEQLRSKILQLDDEGLSVDQLLSLRDYLPSEEEARMLRTYTGEPALLGTAEKYMHAMLDLPSGKARISCMVFKAQLPTRIHSCKAALCQLEVACDDVKNCARLKKVLKTILKVGNQLQEGEQAHVGLSLESLLKLQNTKAFDRKTSVLQYVVCIIAKQDADSLLFVEDLASITVAARLSLEQISAEKGNIRRELDQSLQTLSVLRSEADATSAAILRIQVFFEGKALHQCEDLVKRYSKVHSKFAHLLTYFGEEATISSTDFFTLLSQFVTDFVSARDIVQHSLRAEERKHAASELKEVSRRQSTGRRLRSAESAGDSNNDIGDSSSRRRPSSMKIASSEANVRRAELLNEANASVGRRGSAAAGRRNDGIPKGRSSTSESTILAIQAMVALQVAGSSSNSNSNFDSDITKPTPPPAPRPPQQPPAPSSPQLQPAQVLTVKPPAPPGHGAGFVSVVKPPPPCTRPADSHVAVGSSSVPVPLVKPPPPPRPPPPPS